MSFEVIDEAVDKIILAEDGLALTSVQIVSLSIPHAANDGISSLPWPSFG